jgi:hypothetical protein
MRIAIRCGRQQTDQFEQLFDLPGEIAGGDTVVADRLRQNVANPHSRIERTERVLEYDLHPLPVALTLLALEIGDVTPLEFDAAGRRLLKSKNESRQSGFSGPGFADNAEAFTLADRKRDIIDCMHIFALHRPAVSLRQHE